MTQNYFEPSCEHCRPPPLVTNQVVLNGRFLPSPTKKIPISLSLYSYDNDLHHSRYAKPLFRFHLIFLYISLSWISACFRDGTNGLPFQCPASSPMGFRRKDNPLFFFYTLDVHFFLVGLLYDLCCVWPMLSAYGYYHPLIEYSLLLLPPFLFSFFFRMY